MGREQVALWDLPVQPSLTVNERLALNIFSSECYIFGMCRDAQKSSFVDEATGLHPVIFPHNLFITELEQGSEVVPVWYKVIERRNCATRKGARTGCVHAQGAHRKPGSVLRLVLHSVLPQPTYRLSEKVESIMELHIQ